MLVLVVGDCSDTRMRQQILTNVAKKCSLGYAYFYQLMSQLIPVSMIFKSKKQSLPNQTFK